MSRNYDVGIFIGRFQPFHNGHKAAIDKALEFCKELYVFIGSSNEPRNIKNPFTYGERAALIQEVYPDRVTIFALEDFPYSDEMWREQVLDVLKSKTGSKCIVGVDKDKSTYYLKAFDLTFEAIEQTYDINATDLRYGFFSRSLDVFHEVPLNVYKFLEAFNFTSEYDYLGIEYDYIKSYNLNYEKLPFPPIFSTIDSVVICNGHVLLIKRGGAVGHGLWALPGGFLDHDETIAKGTRRELKEETGLSVVEDFETKVFDAPGRSQLGRVITHATLFYAPGKELPKVKASKASDDALEAKWFTWSDYIGMRNQMHDDHFHIISIMLERFQLRGENIYVRQFNSKN